MEKWRKKERKKERKKKEQESAEAISGLKMGFLAKTGKQQSLLTPLHNMTSSNAFFIKSDEVHVKMNTF